jgi:hypothetical protein
MSATGGRAFGPRDVLESGNVRMLGCRSFLGRCALGSVSAQGEIGCLTYKIHGGALGCAPLNFPCSEALVAQMMTVCWVMAI